VGRDIVPVGLATATLCNLVVGTILLAANSAGIPQSLVQLNGAAVLAVALAKHGREGLAERRVVRKIAVLWVITPLLAAGITIALLRILS